MTSALTPEQIDAMFERWWDQQIARNGGVPIGADYRHWAEAAFRQAMGMWEEVAYASGHWKGVFDRTAQFIPLGIEVAPFNMGWKNQIPLYRLKEPK